jgi:steroid delta-isomerase-like uncharacterized protein
MSLDENRKLTSRFYEEVVNQRNFDLIDQLVADDFVEHETMPGMPTGKEAPRAFMEMFVAAFPDMQMTPDVIVAEGDLVATKGTVKGTHSGEFMGIPATGKSFEVQFMDFVRIRDGQAIEHWGVTDTAAMMEQLGLTPEM